MRAYCVSLGRCLKQCMRSLWSDRQTRRRAATFAVHNSQDYPLREAESVRPLRPSSVPRLPLFHFTLAHLMTALAPSLAGMKDVSDRLHHQKSRRRRRCIIVIGVASTHAVAVAFQRWAMTTPFYATTLSSCRIPPTSLFPLTNPRCNCSSLI